MPMFVPAQCEYLVCYLHSMPSGWARSHVQTVLGSLPALRARYHKIAQTWKNEISTEYFHVRENLNLQIKTTASMTFTYICLLDQLLPSANLMTISFVNANARVSSSSSLNICRTFDIWNTGYIHKC